MLHSCLEIRNRKRNQKFLGNICNFCFVTDIFTYSKKKTMRVAFIKCHKKCELQGENIYVNLQLSEWKFLKCLKLV